MAMAKKKTRKKTPATRAKKETKVTAAEATPARGLSPFEEIDRLFHSVMPRRWQRPYGWEWPALSEIHMPFEGRTPHVDVIDRDQEILVRAEVPGVDKDDLEVSMTDNTVTIKASTEFEQKDEKGDFYRHEISKGSFTRTVALPGDVNGTKAKAKFKNGILELTLPKLEKSKRTRIQVD